MMSIEQAREILAQPMSSADFFDISHEKDALHARYAEAGAVVAAEMKKEQAAREAEYTNGTYSQW